MLPAPHGNIGRRKAARDYAPGPVAALPGLTMAALAAAVSCRLG
ncbi:hypothetical protein ACFWF3_32205 [Nocardia sp. NPDC060220]